MQRITASSFDSSGLTGTNIVIVKELGRWESLEMVQRYTRSFTFQDSMKFYRSPLTGN